MFGEPAYAYDGGPHYSGDRDPSNMESNTKDRFGFDDASIRAAFVRKVFAIVTVMLLIVIMVTLPVIVSMDVRRWIIENTWIHLVAFIVFIVVYLCLICCQSLARLFPVNLGLLGIFSLAAGAMLMVLCAMVPPSTVLLALITTTLSCGAIILFAFQTTFDITKYMFLIFAAGMAILIFGISVSILSLFVKVKALHTVYTALVCVLFMVYLALDIQMIVGGRKYNISPEEYVFAALLLFIDIYGIFITLLSLFNNE